MRKLTCMDKVRLIYATQVMEDATMTWQRAIDAHTKFCKLKEKCGVRTQLEASEKMRATSEARSADVRAAA